MEEKIFNTPSGKVGARITKPEGFYSNKYQIYEVANPNNTSLDCYGIGILYIGVAKITGKYHEIHGWEINYQVKCHEDQSNS